MVRAAIIETALTQFVAEGRELYTATKAADEAVVITEKKLEAARDIARARRIELGMFLRKIRGQLPARGTSDGGWRSFLEGIEMAASTAHQYMAEAGIVSNRTGFDSPKLEHSEVPHQDDVPPPSDEDAPSDADVPVVEPNRGGWCTPKKWADAVGSWDLDAFSNGRSHIVAPDTCMLERGDDGFGDGTPGSYRIGDVLRTAIKSTRFWGQPEYHNAFVVRALEHYGHTRFCFLLRLDTSTGWFEQLWSISEVIMIPRGERIEFEPPPGVESSSNPYPHGFYYRSVDDVTDAIRNACFEWRISR